MCAKPRGRTQISINEIVLLNFPWLSCEPADCSRFKFSLRQSWPEETSYLMLCLGIMRLLFMNELQMFYHLAATVVYWCGEREISLADVAHFTNVSLPQHIAHQIFFLSIYFVCCACIGSSSSRSREITPPTATVWCLHHFHSLALAQTGGCWQLHPWWIEVDGTQMCCWACRSDFCITAQHVSRWTFQQWKSPWFGSDTDQRHTWGVYQPNSQI